MELIGSFNTHNCYQNGPCGTAWIWTRNGSARRSSYVPAVFCQGLDHQRVFLCGVPPCRRNVRWVSEWRVVNLHSRRNFPMTRRKGEDFLICLKDAPFVFVLVGQELVAGSSCQGEAKLLSRLAQYAAVTWRGVQVGADDQQCNGYRRLQVASINQASGGGKGTTMRCERVLRERVRLATSSRVGRGESRSEGGQRASKQGSHLPFFQCCNNASVVRRCKEALGAVRSRWDSAGM